MSKVYSLVLAVVVGVGVGGLFCLIVFTPLKGAKQDYPDKNTRPKGYKTFFMLSSAETKIYPAHKC